MVALWIIGIAILFILSICSIFNFGLCVKSSESQSISIAGIWLVLNIFVLMRFIEAYKYFV